MRLGTLEVLSDSETREIHEATVDILENCGVQVLHHGMLDFLAERGLNVDRETGIVRFSRAVIEDGLATIPHQFEVFDREGEFAYVLGDGRPKIAAGHNAIFWVDAETGETRTSTRGGYRTVRAAVRRDGSDPHRGHPRDAARHTRRPAQPAVGR